MKDYITVEEMIEALKLMPPEAVCLQYNTEYSCWDNVYPPILYTVEEAKAQFPWIKTKVIPEGTTHIVSI